jgi:multidrug resistance efflux pump
MIKYLAFTLCSVVIAGAVAIVDRQSFSLGPGDDYASSEPAAAPARIYASGIIEGRTEDVELRLEVAGRVTEVCVHEGDWVEAGDVLVRLDDRRERQQVAASLANQRLAEANLERLINGARESERQEARNLLTARQARRDQARLALQRIRMLRAQDAVTQQEADDKTSEVDALTAETAAAQARLEQLEAPAREDEVRAAQARVASAQAEHELANIVLGKTELRAPSRSQVLDVHVEPGELVAAGVGEPVIVLADTSLLRVRAFVEEIDAPRITLGAQATIKADGLPGREFSATVSSLSPQMRPKSMTSGNPDELYDTKVREVLLDVAPVDGVTELIAGLRVDVTLSAAPEVETPGGQRLVDATLQETASSTSP